MMCCICKATEATVHLTRSIGAMMKQVDLCEGCATANLAAKLDYTDFSKLNKFFEAAPPLKSIR